jgi:hypothetical protein
LANKGIGNSGVGHAGNFHIANAIQNLMEHHPSFNEEKDSLGKGFITKTKPHLSRGMDHLNNFAEHIGEKEMHYQSVLDSLEGADVDLETKVRLEDSAKQHVINLKALHEKQKVTLTKITELFLQLSKGQLQEMRRAKRVER